MPIPLDHLAAHLDPSYECLKGGQRHRAAHYLLAPPLERLIQFGGVDAVQPDQLPGDDDGVAVDDLRGTGKGSGTAERQNSNETGRETPEHRAAKADQIKFACARKKPAARAAAHGSRSAISAKRVL